jgi:hypothetical protein
MISPHYMHTDVPPRVYHWKDLPYKSQLYIHSPLCMPLCIFRQSCVRNDWKHISQLNGLSPLCIFWCTFRAPCCVNDLPHSSQVYGWSPLCMRLCTSEYCYTRIINYTYHIYMEALLCASIWAFRLLFRMKDLSHMSQVYGRPSVCVRWCACRFDGCLNDLLHTPQV